MFYHLELPVEFGKQVGGFCLEPFKLVNEFFVADWFLEDMGVDRVVANGDWPKVLDGMFGVELFQQRAVFDRVIRDLWSQSTLPAECTAQAAND
jgi:hypothetical protein